MNESRSPYETQQDGSESSPYRPIQQDTAKKSPVAQSRHLPRPQLSLNPHYHIEQLSSPESLSPYAPGSSWSAMPRNRQVQQALQVSSRNAYQAHQAQARRPSQPVSLFRNAASPKPLFSSRLQHPPQSPESPFSSPSRPLAPVPRRAPHSGQQYVRHRNHLPSMRRNQTLEQQPSLDRHAPNPTLPSPLFSTAEEESGSPRTLVNHPDIFEPRSPSSPAVSLPSTGERNPFIRVQPINRRQNPVSSPPQIQLPYNWRAATPTFSSLFRISSSRIDEAPAKAIDASRSSPVLEQEEEEDQESSRSSSSLPHRRRIRQRDSDALRILEGAYDPSSISFQGTAELNVLLQGVHNRHVGRISPVIGRPREASEQQRWPPDSSAYLPRDNAGDSQGRPSADVDIDDVARLAGVALGEPLNPRIQKRTLYVFHPVLGSFVPTDHRAEVWFPDADSLNEARAIVVSGPSREVEDDTEDLLERESGSSDPDRSPEGDDESILAFLNGPSPTSPAPPILPEGTPSRPTTPWPGQERVFTSLSAYRDSQDPSPRVQEEEELELDAELTQEYPRPMAVAPAPGPRTAGAGKRSVSQKVGRTVKRAFGGLRRRKKKKDDDGGDGSFF